MNDIILKIFGVEHPPKSVFESLSVILLKPWPLLLILFILLAISFFISYLYKRTKKPIPRFTQISLTVLRIISLTIILLLIFEPVLSVKFSAEKKPHFVILIDNSLSMDVNYPNEGRRLDTIKKVLNNKQVDFINKLQKKYDLNIITFSSTTKTIKLSKDNPKIDISADKISGQSTDIGKALSKALEKLKGEVVSGVILISDGGSNSGIDPLASAYDLKYSKIPVFALGVGNAVPPKDIRVLPDILVPEEVFILDDVLVVFDVVNIGYKGKEVVAQILEGNKKIAEKKVVIKEEKEKQRVSIKFKPSTKGEHRYKLKISSLKGELSDENNEKNFVVKVTEEKIKVLYVEGKPNRLFRFVRNALHREMTVNFTVLLESASREIKEAKGVTPIKDFPSSEKELFEYDVLIIGDIDTRNLSSKQYDLIKKFVNEGRGVFFIADDVNEGAPASFKGIKQIEDILPVSLMGARKKGFAARTKSDEFSMIITPEGLHNEVMKIKEDPQENEKFWKKFKLNWCARVGDSKPASIVLAVHPKLKTPKGKPLPLIVLGRYGEGKVIYLGIQEVWRTRYGVEDKYFWSSFFRPLLHWLTPEKGAGKKFVILKTDKRQYAGGEKVKINAILYKTGHIKFTGKKVTAKIQVDNKIEEITLLRRENIYQGVYIPSRSGDYKIWISNAPGVPNPEKGKINFYVEIPNLELEHPEMNEKLLKKIAQITGGKYYHIKDSKKLFDNVLKSKAKIPINKEKEIHDTPLIALVLITFFCAEWYLRRKRALA